MANKTLCVCVETEQQQQQQQKERKLKKPEKKTSHSGNRKQSKETICFEVVDCCCLQQK